MEGKKNKKSYDFEFKLSVIECAKAAGNRAAGRKFNVDEKRVREWRKQEAIIVACLKQPSQKNKLVTRKRIFGAGRKRVSNLLDEAVFDWILAQREISMKVSRRSIQQKARELFSTLEKNSRNNFKASNGWLQKFMERNNLSLRRKIASIEKDPVKLNKKIASFILYVSNIRKSKEILNHDLIVAMDETRIFFDISNGTTPMHGHEKEYATIVLAAKANGIKLTPFVVFKNSTQSEERTDLIVRSSVNGWMNQELTVEWLKTVYTKFSFQRRLLVWDSYRYHISTETTKELREYNTDVGVIPVGCTKYVQPANISWNKPFKQHITDFYDKWLSESEQKKHTRNLQAPGKRLILKWVMDAWKLLPTEMIIESFKACALSICPDGNEDYMVHCIKPGAAREKAADVLRSLRFQQVVEELTIEEDVEETEANEILIDSDIDDASASESEETC